MAGRVVLDFVGSKPNGRQVKVSAAKKVEAVAAK
jgi:hypothetical protein